MTSTEDNATPGVDSPTHAWRRKFLKASAGVAAALALTGFDARAQGGAHRSAET